MATDDELFATAITTSTDDELFGSPAPNKITAGGAITTGSTIRTNKEAIDNTKAKPNILSNAAGELGLVDTSKGFTGNTYQDIPTFIGNAANNIFAFPMYPLKKIMQAESGFETLFGGLKPGEFERITARNQEVLGKGMNAIGYVSGVMADLINKPDAEIGKTITENWRDGRTIGDSIKEGLVKMGAKEGEVTGMMAQLTKQGVDFTTMFATLKGTGIGVEAKNNALSELAKGKTELMRGEMAKTVKEQNIQDAIKYAAKDKEFIANDVMGSGNFVLDVIKNEVENPQVKIERLRSGGDFGKYYEPDTYIPKTLEEEQRLALEETKVEKIPFKQEIRTSGVPFKSESKIGVKPKEIVPLINSNDINIMKRVIDYDAKKIGLKDYTELDTTMKNIGDAMDSITPKQVSESNLSKVGSYIGKNVADLKEQGKKYALSVKEFVASSGVEGKKLSEAMQAEENLIDRTTAKYMKDWKPITNKFSDIFVNKKLRENLADVIEGKAEPIDPIVKEAADKWAKVREQIANEITARGMKVTLADGTTRDFMPRDMYLPHNISWENYREGGSYREEGIVKIMAKEGITREPAVEILDGILKNNDTPMTKNGVMMEASVKTQNGNIHFARDFNFSGYEKDAIKVINQYITNISREFANQDIFGKEGEIGDEMIIKASKEHGISSDQVRKMVNMSRGKLPSEGRSLVGRSARELQTVAKISLATISHIPQIARIFRYDGVKGLIEAVKDFSGAKEKAYDSGALTENLNQDFVQNLGITKIFMKSTGLRPFRVMLKTIGGSSARVYADRMFKTFKDNQVTSQEFKDFSLGKATPEIKTKIKTNIETRRQLNKFGIDADVVVKRGNFSPDEYLDITQKGANQTAFAGKPTDYPMWASDNAFGRLIFQFKRWPYDQMMHSIDDIVGEGVKHGNWKPFIATSMVAGPVLGIGANMIKKMIKGQPLTKEDQTMVSIYLEGVMTFATLGLMQEVILSGQYGKLQPLATAAGPVLSETSEAMSNVAKGNGSALGKQVVRNVPYGNIVSARTK